MAHWNIVHVSRSLGFCKSCRAPIEWGKRLESGKMIPFDAPRGMDFVEQLVINGQRVDVIDTEKFPSHFTTCKDAKQWSRGRRRAS